MTDPIERVARVLCRYWAGAKRRNQASDNARIAIGEYKAWLTEQGIPIDKLLSGEMKAVPAWAVKEGESFEDACHRVAQLDYAGNPPVTPEENATLNAEYVEEVKRERCQERVGATESKKWALPGDKWPPKLKSS